MALRKVGVIFTAQGHAQYMSELKQVNQEMRTMSTQAKLAVAQLGNNASISDTYSTKMKSMGSELQVAGNRTKMLTDLQKTLTLEQEKLPKLVDSATNSYKESNKETIKLRKSYKDLAAAKGEDAQETLEAEKAYKSSLKETNKLKKEMKELEIVYRDNGKQLEKLPNDIAKAELATAKLTNAQQRLHEEYRNQGGRLADTAKSWQDFGNQAGVISDKLNTAGNYMTTRFTVPIVAGFTTATVAAGKFQTEIGMLGPLIAEGGNITAEHRKQMDELGKSSREWAVDYGKSTSEINAGMAELIRNGYSSAQVMGMIPNVLDASLASGEDFNAVMKTSANVLSQFQLRGKDTNETLTNTQRVVDSLTYVANATSSGFYDLGQGMAYVGPVANTLNMSVEETASILGILSDNGIEASQGGTALRGALTRLLKPSKQNAEAMAELGINLEDYQNGLLDFPTILDTVAKNTANLTDEQKAALIATAFGTEAQSAMNALVSAGGDELRNMTTEAKNAAGATKEIAGAMQELPEFKFQQLMAEVRDLGIEVGTHLLPIVMDGMGVIKDWASAFGELDESTQQMIIKTGLAVAAAGPLLKTFVSIAKGAELGSKGIGKLIQIYGKLTTPKSIIETATELGKIPGAATKAGGAAALFSNPWVVGGAVAIAGVSAFVAYMNHQANLPFAKHQEAVDETNGAYQEWFDGVASGIGTIEELSQSAIEGATATSEAYLQALEDIRGANVDTQENLDKMFGDNFFGGNRFNYFEGEWLSQFRLEVDNIAGAMQRLGATESEIAKVQQAFNNYGTLLTGTSNEVLRLYQAEQKVTADWALSQTRAVDTVTQSVVTGLRERQDARKADLDAQLQGNYISQEMYQQEINNLNSYTEQAISSVQTSTQSIKEIFATASREGRVLRENELLSFTTSLANISKITGESLSENQEIMKMLGDNMSFLSSEVMVEWMRGEEIMSDSMIKMFKNAGSTEEALGILVDALDAYGAKEIKPKEAYVETEEAKVELMSLEELVANWNNMTIEEREAQVKVLGKEEMAKFMEMLGIDWENLSPTQQEYYAQAFGVEAMENLLYLTGEFERGTDTMKKFAILETQVDSEAILSFIEFSDLWNNADFMSLAMEIDMNAPDAKAQLVDLINYFQSKEVLPPLQMETEALTEESQQKLANLISAYTGAPVDEVLMFLTDTNADKTTEKINATGNAVRALDGTTAGVIINAVDNASGIIASVGRGMSGLDGRVATTYVDTVSRGRKGFATGGHIDAYAEGGNIQYAGMFASGGNVPKGYSGIVGEAGPEIFTVTNRGVSITPLNSKEKMRGVQGAVADEVSKQLNGKGGSGGDTININITGPTFRDEVDMDKLVTKINKVLGTQVHNKKRGRPA